MGNNQEENSLDENLKKAASIVFPDRPEYGYIFMCNLVNAMYVIDEEVRTEMMIQKYCDILRLNGVRIFEPFSYYLGGVRNDAIVESLDTLQQLGVFTPQRSKLNDVNADTYNFSPNAYDELDTMEQPRGWEDLYQLYVDRNGAKNIWEKHDKKVYKRLAAKEDYIGTNPEPLREEGVKISVPELTKELAIQYKNIGYNDRSEYEYARRKFSVRYLKQDFKEDAEELIDEVVLLCGYFDTSEESTEDKIKDIRYLREDPRSPNCIRVRFEGQYEIPKAEVPQYSVGIVGKISEYRGEPIIDAFGVLRLGRLPPQLLEETDQNRIEEIATEHQKIRQKEHAAGDPEESQGDSLDGLFEEMDEVGEQESDDDMINELKKKFDSSADMIGRLMTWREAVEIVLRNL